MRAILFALPLFLLLVPSAQAHGTTSHHGPGVESVHYPETAPRSRPIPVEVHVGVPDDVAAVRLVYCRVQHYACGPALNMTSNDGGRYAATIPWTARFFEGVTTVGIRLEIVSPDGEVQRSPIEHYPARPSDLPAGGDVYYYLTLEEDAPAGSWLGPLLALALVAVMRR